MKQEYSPDSKIRFTRDYVQNSARGLFTNTVRWIWDLTITPAPLLRSKRMNRKRVHGPLPLISQQLIYLLVSSQPP